MDYEVKMPTEGDPSGIPQTSTVKNKDILITIEGDRDISYYDKVVLKVLQDLIDNKVRSLTLLRKDGINSL